MTTVAIRRISAGSPLLPRPWPLVLALAGCSGPGGNPDTADSAQCDDGFLCGSYVDGDGDGNVSRGEWDGAFSAADTNGDGQISRGEFEGGGGNWGGGGRGGR